MSSLSYTIEKCKVHENTWYMDYIIITSEGVISENGVRMGGDGIWLAQNDHPDFPTLELTMKVTNLYVKNPDVFICIC